MKQCPRCGQTYTDNELNFCLNDGEPLTVSASAKEPFDDSPPTVMMDPTRVTNPSHWQPAPPPAQWQPPQTTAQPQMMAQPQGYNPPFPRTLSPDQTLAVVSLCLGIGSLTIGWCCSLGLLLSPAAMITGFIALAQIKKDPNRHGGKGLAIGGISMGSIFIALYIIIIVIYGLASLIPRFANIH